MKRVVLGAVLLAVLVGVATGPSAMSLSTTPDVAPGEDAPDAATANDSRTPSNESTVNVTVGRQLSTILDVSSGDVRTGFGNTAFEVSIENASEEERAESIADRAVTLRDDAESIHEDYRTATETYEDGKITKTNYAQRLATLNARASNVLDGYERLQRRAANVSALELKVAGLDRSALNTSVANLSSVTGAGAAALLDRFTGESRGDVRIETGHGLVIEVERGERTRSRQIERPRDGDDGFSVGQSDALGAARGALSDPGAGNWALAESTVGHDSGTFAFAFRLRNATEMTGNAILLVDGSSGKIVTLDEVIETTGEGEEGDRTGHHHDDRDDEHSDWDHDWVDGDDDVRDHPDVGDWWDWGTWGNWWDGPGEDRHDRELAIIMTGGVPASNETIEVRVFDGGAVAENASVFLNDRAVGTTDSDGTVEVTLPASGDAKLTARDGDAEGELRLELDQRRGRGSELLRKLDVNAVLDGDLVTATVRYAGVGVANASVRANDRTVGRTNADGVVTLTVDPNETDELAIEVNKGAFSTELQYVIRDGELVMRQGPRGTDDHDSGWWNGNGGGSGEDGGGWDDGENGWADGDSDDSGGGF